jgi:hypothetical protein
MCSFGKAHVLEVENFYFLKYNVDSVTAHLLPSPPPHIVVSCSPFFSPSDSPLLPLHDIIVSYSMYPLLHPTHFSCIHSYSPFHH